MAPKNDNYANMTLPEKIESIERIKKQFLKSDNGKIWMEFAIEKDPALQGKPRKQQKQEVLSYPGLTALATYFEAHDLYKEERFADARHLSEAAHTLTGMDIHPGASIHPKVFFDHCTGMVIGETASVGEGCVFYHGVTLGGIGKETEDLTDSVTGEIRKNARHPQVGKNVTISVGTQILGPTVIEDGVNIGPGSQIQNSRVCLGAIIGPSTNIVRSIVEPGHSVYSRGNDITHLPKPENRDDFDLQKKKLQAFRRPHVLDKTAIDEVYNKIVGSTIGLRQSF